MEPQPLENFSFATTKDIKLDIKILTTENKPLKYALVKFYYPDNDIAYEPVFKALTDSNGVLKGNFLAPARRNSLVVDVICPGIRRNIIFQLKDEKLSATINGADYKVTYSTYRNDPTPAKVSFVYVDTDKDGVEDTYDEFPTDPNKVYTLYYPAKGSWGTLAFEDSWPIKGDYDMNDLVVHYNYAMVCTRLGSYVDITAKYKVVAAGTLNSNGLGINLPFISLFTGNKSPIEMVTGQRLTNNYIKTSSLGFEEEGVNIIPFDNHRSVAKGHVGVINAKLGDAKIDCEEVTVHVKFKDVVSPVGYSGFYNFKWGTINLYPVPFNPFLIGNGKRAYEIHQIGYDPTHNGKSAGLMSLFNTGDDAFGYRSKDGGKPWVLNFAEPFEYPVETASLSSAYLHFDDWKAGLGYADWYMDKPGYRNNSLIYR
ncbi:MAG: LruC domain-containing protein [Pyrinomonadaceae bacterium]|nr:LruC domain-containing protein [Sphingobacteriaceae bacterium]